ncbi:hypothetical protein C0L77_000613 [Clostridium perfringens]
MKKSDLENGMIVEYRNGLRRIVLGDKFLGEQGSLGIWEYDDNLNNVECCSEFDIVKVYTVESSLCVNIGSIFLNRSLNIIWERPRELDWSKVPFGTKVLVSDYLDNLNETDGFEMMFVGYEPKLEEHPFIVAYATDDDASSFRYCKIHPDEKIQEEWYKE